jgi:mannose PTS system EIID component
VTTREAAPPALPLAARAGILVRLLAIQGSWNYESLSGNGIAFCLEPVLRRLPGGRGGEMYRAALARECQYFNAHPYLAAVAVGALARAELDQESPDRIERFRTALCGPLGSVGDRLIWAGWLPLCSVLALAVFGFGGGPLAVTLVFLLTYNVGHLALRIWGLDVGWRQGLRVAQSLGTPLLRKAPPHVMRAAAFVAGVAIPLALHRVIGPGRGLLGGVLAAVALGAIAIVKMQGRAEGWKLALGALGVFALVSVTLHV